MHAPRETPAALRSHIFNGVIWPDFTRLASAEHRTLSLVAAAVDDVLDLLSGKRVEVLDSSHTVRRWVPRPDEGRSSVIGTAFATTSVGSH